MSKAILFSIGHSNHPEGVFIKCLKRHSITTLIDVRSVPYSRFNPQFNRAALEDSLDKAGIKYSFKGDALGGRAHPDADMVALIAKLARYVKRHAGDGTAMCMMCSEGHPKDCHRHWWFGQFLTMYFPEIEIRHIHPTKEFTPADAKFTPKMVKEFGEFEFPKLWGRVKTAMKQKKKGS